MKVHVRTTAIHRWALALGCVVAAWTVAGCQTNDDTARGAGSACSLVELTQPCTDCGVGRQVCTPTGWSECDCGIDGSSGAGAAGGRTAVTAGALRTDITFDWDETAAGQGGSSTGELCVPGTYEGTYMLDFTPVAAPAFVTPTTGPCIVVFGTERRGEFLATAEGSTLEVHFLEPIINATMELDGGVNCDTGAFDATSVDCQWDTNGIPGGSCMSELHGTFDPATNSITGTVTTDVMNQGMGDGTFVMTLLP